MRESTPTADDQTVALGIKFVPDYVMEGDRMFMEAIRARSDHRADYFDLVVLGLSENFTKNLRHCLRKFESTNKDYIKDVLNFMSVKVTESH